MQRWIPIIFLVILAGTYGYGHHKGWAERDTEMQLEIAAKNEEARAAEKKLNDELSTTTLALQEANNAISQKQGALDAAIRAGRVRLPASSCVQASAGSTSASGGGAEAASESDRETLRLIAEIVAQGDRNTEQLNACIDAYNKVMESVNAQR